MKERNLAALCLLVNDFEKSFHFYTNILKLELRKREGNYADFKTGNTIFEISLKEDSMDMVPLRYMGNGGGTVISFKISEFDELFDSLKEKNIEIIEGPKMTPWDERVMYVLDPDMNIIELNEIV